MRGSGSWSMNLGERVRSLRSFDEDWGCPFGAGDGYRETLKQVSEAGTASARRIGKRYGKDAESVASVRGSCEYSPKLGT